MSLILFTYLKWHVPLLMSWLIAGFTAFIAFYWRFHEDSLQKRLVAQRLPFSTP